MDLCIFNIPVFSPSSLFSLPLILSCHFLGLTTWRYKSILAIGRNQVWGNLGVFFSKVFFMLPVKCVATGEMAEMKRKARPAERSN